MIADPRFEQFVDRFAMQWLKLERIEAFDSDRLIDRRGERLAEDAKHSMIRETRLFIAAVFREDRPLTDFINGDFAFVDQRVADIYEMHLSPEQKEALKAVPGTMIRVPTKLLSGSRAGLLTQASVLTATSYSTRTSPTLRGAWILEKMLGMPPPPPPPDVPELGRPSRESVAALTTRQQLETHRQNPACAGCHGRIDPLGFALEGYNAFGQVRYQEYVRTPNSDKVEAIKIDASAVLPSGEKIVGEEGLRQSLLGSYRNEFYRCVTTKLTTYALRRGLVESELCIIKEILAAAEKDEYRAAALLKAIVLHPEFRNH